MNAALDALLVLAGLGLGAYLERARSYRRSRSLTGAYRRESALEVMGRWTP